MTLYEYDAQVIEKFGVVCGVDEAGRGPLAGDVFAAAVIFNRDTIIDGINDSKKLSEKKRELLYETIINNAEDFCISNATIDEIEELNILGASMLAMKRAVEGLVIKPNIAIVDGNRKPDLDIKVACIVKGDGTSQSIAAASILAKVSRDRYMLEMDKEMPQYHFCKHKGYGTKLHYEMLEQHGISKFHRPSFLKKLLKNG